MQTSPSTGDASTGIARAGSDDFLTSALGLYQQPVCALLSHRRICRYK